MITEERLKRLDDLPQKETMAQLRRLGRLPLHLQPLGAGVWGSAYRRDNQPQRAHVSISRGIHLARALGQDTGDLLQRAGCTSAFSGKLVLALRLATEAESEHASVGRVSGAGRALVDQGEWLYHLDRKSEAAYKYNCAGNLLSTSDHKNRAARAHGLAILSMEAGSLDDGLKFWEEAAHEAKSCATRFAVGVLWAGARFFAATGDSMRAETELLWLYEAHIEFDERENAAIALLERAQLQFQRGALDGARENVRLATRLAFERKALSPGAEAVLVALSTLGDEAWLLKIGISQTLERLRKVQGAEAPAPLVN